MTRLAQRCLGLLLLWAAVFCTPALANDDSITPEASLTASVWLGGRETLVDVYAPQYAPRGAMILVHGFARSRKTMIGHAQALAAAGVLALVPDMPYVVDSRDNARALLDLIRMVREGKLAAPADRIVLVGFSAGGLAALLAASAPGVVGYVGLDPFDRPNQIGLDAARLLQVPAMMIRAPSSPCNAFSVAAPWVPAFPKLQRDQVIEGAVHCDFESPTDFTCRMICGKPDPMRQQVVREALLEAARTWLAPR